MRTQVEVAGVCGNGHLESVVIRDIETGEQQPLSAGASRRVAAAVGEGSAAIFTIHRYLETV